MVELLNDIVNCLILYFKMVSISLFEKIKKQEKRLRNKKQKTKKTFNKFQNGLDKFVPIIFAVPTDIFV